MSASAMLPNSPTSMSLSQNSLVVAAAEGRAFVFDFPERKGTCFMLSAAIHPRCCRL
jgi:hypothetical protein